MMFCALSEVKGMGIKMEEIYKMIMDLEERGITLKVSESGKLVFKGPEKKLDESVLSVLRGSKDEIIQVLRNNHLKFCENKGISDTNVPFELTEVQAAYMLGRENMFEYSGVGCHIYMELEYETLDFTKVQSAWNILLQRHDMLRMKITDEKMQIISEQVPENVVTLWKTTVGDEQEILAQIRKEYGNKLYNVNTAPLFDVGVVNRAKEKDILFISMDLLIADWTSIWLLIREFEDIYFYEKKLSSLNVTYKSYIEFQAKRKTSIQFYRDKQFWNNKITKIPDAPQFPLLTAEEKELDSSEFEHHCMILDKDTWNKIVNVAKKTEITPTVAVMTAYVHVIRKWSSNKEFSLNLTLLNRNNVHPDIEKVVGDFTEISILECSNTEHLSFGEGAKVLQRQLFENLGHKDFSGINVLREIGRVKGREKAMMPYVFTSAIGLLGKTIDKPYIGHMNKNGISQTPQVFIDCQAMDDSDGLKVFWDVRKGVFPDYLVEDMFRCFEEQLNKLADENYWKQEINISLPKWQKEERDKSNKTAKKRDIRRIEEAFVKAYEKNPDKIAVFDLKCKYTYREIFQYSLDLKDELLRAGCMPGDYVGIMLDKSSGQVISALGILFAGAVYVPIDIELPKERKKRIIAESGIDILISNEQNVVDEVGCRCICMDQICKANENKEVSNTLGGIEESAYVIFTSGSTGKPKGVEVSHEAAMNTILDIIERLDINEKDVLIGISKMSFDLSVFDLFGSLIAGATLVIPEDSVNPDYWEDLITQYQVTVWNSVPALAQILFCSGQYGENSRIQTLKKVLLSGDWIPVGLPGSIHKMLPGVRILGLGGATEAAIWSICHECLTGEEYKKSVPYGVPLSNQTLYVLDSDLRDCPVWVKGDIYIGGKGVAKGYINNNSATQAAFILDNRGRIYKTGDKGRYLPGGEIEFLGREDTQVKINGYRIELEEIESVLNRLKEVSQAVALVSKDKILTVVVTVQNKSQVSEEEIQEYLARYLPRYMVPQNICILDKLPLTSNGKVDRNELQANCASLGKENLWETKKVTSGNKILNKLLDMWRTTLQTPQLGMEDNLYNYGADSLIMAQMVSRIRNEYSVDKGFKDIPFDKLLRQILNYPSVIELYRFVSGYQFDAPGLVETNLAQDDTTGVINSFYEKEGDTLQVLLHAGFGTMNCFRYLITYMQKEAIGTIVGITIKDSDRYCSLNPENLIETLADEYVDLILRFGKKRIQIIGYCISGLIAVEMARRLIEKGIEVYDLILIDSHPIHYQLEDRLLLEIMFLPSLSITMAQLDLGAISSEEFYNAVLYLYNKYDKKIPTDTKQLLPDSYDTLIRALWTMEEMGEEKRFALYSAVASKYTGNDMPSSMCLELFKSFAQSFKAAQYRPDIYLGDIRFLLAEEPSSFIPDEDKVTLAFWETICLGNFSVEVIKGDHITCTENEENAEELCRKISSCFREGRGEK